MKTIKCKIFAIFTCVSVAVCAAFLIEDSVPMISSAAVAEEENTDIEDITTEESDETEPPEITTQTDESDTVTEESSVSTTPRITSEPQSKTPEEPPSTTTQGGGFVDITDPPPQEETPDDTADSMTTPDPAFTTTDDYFNYTTSVSQSDIFSEMSTSSPQTIAPDPFAYDSDSGIGGESSLAFWILIGGITVGGGAGITLGIMKYLKSQIYKY